MDTNSNLQMKPLKAFGRKFGLRRKTGISRFCELLLKPWDWLSSKFYRYRKCLRRSWAFAKIGWDNYDFDSCYLLELMVFKLKRLYVGCTADAVAVHEDNHLQALRLAIRIGERLCKDDYSYFMDCHNKKWGESELIETPVPEGQYPEWAGRAYDVRIHRAKVTDETKEQERQEFLAAVNADDAIKKREARWFFSIIEKYYPFWWD